MMRLTNYCISLSLSDATRCSSTNFVLYDLTEFCHLSVTTYSYYYKSFLSNENAISDY